MEKLLIEKALNSKFYQDKLCGIKTKNWDEIPFTVKKDLREADPYELLGTTLNNIATYHETSGTTGKPSSSWFSFKDIELEAKLTVESSLKLNEFDVVLNRFPFALAIPSFILYWACQLSKATHIAVSKSSLITPHLRVIDIILRAKPTIITLIPAEAEIIGNLAKSLNIKLPTNNLRGIVLGGEVISPNRKKYIEKLWGVPIFSSFGSTETGGLFMTCIEGHYHVDHPISKIEILNNKNEFVLNDTQGNMVISIAREGMPLLRYANGDIAKIKSLNNCQCGNENPILIHYGRKDDQIIIGDSVLNIYDLQEVVYSLNYIPILWRVVVHSDYLEFKYQMFNEEKNEKVKREIENDLNRLLNINVRLKFINFIDEKELSSIPKYSKFHYIEKTNE